MICSTFYCHVFVFFVHPSYIDEVLLNNRNNLLYNAAQFKCNMQQSIKGFIQCTHIVNYM